uniref:Uncharacterized protein n=1 Tax=Panagrolaimus davidi TaxID=227884 RepID=A0A914R1N0_9BILA
MDYIKPKNDDNLAIIYKPDYEILNESYNGKKEKYLYIFDDENRKYCYKFRKQGNNFVCSKCAYRKRYIKATIEKDNNDKEMVLLKTNKKHICEPIEYDPQEGNGEIKIIYPPNFQLVKRRFKGKILQKLVIFDTNDKSLCYEYTWMESHNFYRCNPCIELFSNVFAKLKFDKDGKEYVELGKNEHVCKLKKFIPENLVANILKEPDFKIDKYIWRGAEKRRILVFDKTKPGHFYVYGFKTGNTFLCSPCEKKFHKYVIVKLYENESEEKYIEIKGEHFCKSRNKV